MFEGRLEMYILLIAGSALRRVPMRMVFSKPVSGITDSGDFVVKKAPARRPGIRPDVEKMENLRQIFGLGCPESSKNGVRTETAIGDF